MIPPVLCSLIRLSAYIITILQCDANIFIHRRQKTTQMSLTMMNIKFVYRILDRKLIRVSYFEGILDCWNTYGKVRVFSYFLALFAIFGLVNPTLIIL